jgi:hypothetical protein
MARRWKDRVNERDERDMAIRSPQALWFSFRRTVHVCWPGVRQKCWSLIAQDAVAN